MRVTICPFYSQQSKLGGKFLLSTDSTLKWYKYAAQRMVEFGWHVTTYIPNEAQRAEKLHSFPGTVCRFPFNLALNNLDRRLQWDPAFFRQVAEESDVVLTMHEFLPLAFKCLGLKVLVLAECGNLPGSSYPGFVEELFPLAWRASNFVMCSSRTIADRVSAFTRAEVLRYAFDEAVTKPRDQEQNIPVLFNSRCSATGYTGHYRFLEAAGGAKWSAVMTDQTEYLAASGECVPLNVYVCGARTGEHYIDLLHRSRVVVGLLSSGSPGNAFLEAVACGAVPVAVHLPAYLEILGPEWPYYCDFSSQSIRRVVERALEGGWPAGEKERIRQLVLETSSYQSCWKRVEEVIRDLVRQRN